MEGSVSPSLLDPGGLMAISAIPWLVAASLPPSHDTLFVSLSSHDILFLRTSHVGLGPASHTPIPFQYDLIYLITSAMTLFLNKVMS